MDLHHLLLAGLPAHSGVPRSTDILGVRRLVSKVPLSVVSRCGKRREQKPSALFSHLVGGGEQRRWDDQSERFGGLEVPSNLSPPTRSLRSPASITAISSLICLSGKVKSESLRETR